MYNIEFRGKVIDSKDYAQGGIYDYGDGAGRHVYIIMGGMFPQFIEVEPDTVVYSTMLKDREGTMIFENDFIEWENDLYGKRIAYVDREGNEYIARRRWNRYENLQEINDCCKVIGNIWDNPELFNEAEK
jgi:hypothetical protein